MSANCGRMAQCYIALMTILDVLETSDLLHKNISVFCDKLHINDVDIRVTIDSYNIGTVRFRELLKTCLSFWISANGKAANVGVLHYVLKEIKLVSTAESLEDLNVCQNCAVFVSASSVFEGIHLGDKLVKIIPAEDQATESRLFLPNNLLQHEINNNRQLEERSLRQNSIGVMELQPLLSSNLPNGHQHITQPDNVASVSNSSPPSSLVAKEVPKVPMSSNTDISTGLPKQAPQPKTQRKPLFRRISLFCQKHQKYLFPLFVLVFFLLIVSHTISVIIIYHLQNKLTLCHANKNDNIPKSVPQISEEPPQKLSSSTFSISSELAESIVIPTQTPKNNPTTPKSALRSKWKIFNLETLTIAAKKGKCKSSCKIHLIVDDLMTFNFTHPNYTDCLPLVETLQINKGMDIYILEKLLFHLPNFESAIFDEITEYCLRSTPTHLFESTFQRDASFSIASSITFRNITSNCRDGLRNLAALRSLRGASHVEFTDCSMIEQNIPEFASFFSVSDYRVNVKCCAQNCNSLLNYDDKLSLADKECSFFSKELLTVKK